MSEDTFKNESTISRDDMGWTLPKGATSEASKLFQHSVNIFGHIIDRNSKIKTKDFADKILEHNQSPQGIELAKQLKETEVLTLVVYNSEKRDPNNISYQYSVVGTNLENAEELIDAIAENESNKRKYKDGNERRLSIYTSEGGELKSTVFSDDKPEVKNTRKLNY